MSLNENQRRFVAEYPVDLNATQAAIRAGYSERTAKQQGARLLTNADVKAAIDAVLADREKRTGITQDRVLVEVGRVAFADIRKAVRWGMKEVPIGYDADGKRLPADQVGDAVVIERVFQPFVEPVDSDDLDDDTAAAIAEVSLGKDGIRIKMHDKLGAVTLAGRHMAMWKDKLEVTPDEDTAALLAEARKRAGI